MIGKRYYLCFIFILLFLNTKLSHASQITGSDTVCAPERYIYTVNIAAADSFKWYLPTGWYFVSGQGTDSVFVTANQTADTIRVAGYDSLGHLVDSVKMAVHWGGGGPGWHIYGYPTAYCPFQDYVLSISSDNNSCGSGSCGDAYNNPNVIYAAYNNVWPTGFYMGIINGTNNFSGGYYGLTIYVYEVDTTFGINNALLVSGGHGCPPENTFNIPPPPIFDLTLTQKPYPACPGDTVTIYSNVSLFFYYWSSDLPFISTYYDSATVAIKDYSNNHYVYLSGSDFNDCSNEGNIYIYVDSCAKPGAAFYSYPTKFCVNSYTNFQDQSTYNPKSWKWIFPGGTPASSSLQNPNNIYYYTPGNYPVTLIASNNMGSDTLTYNNYVTVNPLPVITITHDTALCKGASVQLVSSAAGARYYSWTPSTGLNNPGISNPVSTPIVTTKYIVSIRDSNICYNTDSVTVAIDQPLVLASRDTSLCTGSSVQLTSSGGVSYAWKPAVGLSDSTVANPVASPSITTKYIVIATDANNCKGSDSVKIIVNPLPIVTTNADTSICPDASIQLMASGGVSYAWSPSSGLNDSALANPVANPGSTTEYSVSVTDAKGCTASSVVIVAVNPLLALLITPDTSICVGSTVQLSASGGTIYLWVPGIGLSDSTISNPFAHPQVTTDYSVVVLDNNGCGGNGSVTVNVNPLPVIYVSPDTALCFESSISLFASGGTDYRWTPAAGLNDTTISNPIATPASTTSYSVQVTDANKCLANGTVSITVYPLPVVALTADTALCYGSSLQLVASGGASYLWTPSAGLSDTTIYNPVAVPLETTGYSVYVTDINGCTGVGLINLTIDPITPIPDIIQVGATLYCSNDSSYASYQWYDDTMLVVGATDTVFVATHDGDYNVEVVDINGCRISAGINIIITGLNYNPEEVISLSPNPATKQLTIHATSFHNDAVRISVLNMLGQEALCFSLSLGEGRGEALDISRLPAGIYFVQLKSESGSLVKKFIKE